MLHHIDRIRGEVSRKILGVLAAVSLAMWVQQSMAITPAEEKLVERIKPVAKVCVQGAGM